MIPPLGALKESASETIDAYKKTEEIGIRKEAEK